jgi:hypothetical protein
MDRMNLGWKYLLVLHTYDSRRSWFRDKDVYHSCIEAMKQTLEKFFVIEYMLFAAICI